MSMKGRAQRFAMASLLATWINGRRGAIAIAAAEPTQVPDSGSSLTKRDQAHEMEFVICQIASNQSYGGSLYRHSGFASHLGPGHTDPLGNRSAHRLES